MIRLDMERIQTAGIRLGAFSAADSGGRGRRSSPPWLKERAQATVSVVLLDEFREGAGNPRIWGTCAVRSSGRGAARNGFGSGQVRRPSAPCIIIRNPTNLGRDQPTKTSNLGLRRRPNVFTARRIQPARLADLIAPNSRKTASDKITCSSADPAKLMRVISKKEHDAVLDRGAGFTGPRLGGRSKMGESRRSNFLLEKRSPPEQMGATGRSRPRAIEQIRDGGPLAANHSRAGGFPGDQCVFFRSDGPGIRAEFVESLFFAFFLFFF